MLEPTLSLTNNLIGRPTRPSTNLSTSHQSTISKIDDTTPCSPARVRDLEIQSQYEQVQMPDIFGLGAPRPSCRSRSIVQQLEPLAFSRRTDVQRILRLYDCVRSPKASANNKQMRMRGHRGRVAGTRHRKGTAPSGPGMGVIPYLPRDEALWKGKTESIASARSVVFPDRLQQRLGKFAFLYSRMSGGG